MPLKFLSKNLPAFGLDLSSSSLKFMQFKRVASGVDLRSCHDSPLPKGLVVNDSITDAKTFNVLLKKALDKPQYGKIDTSYVVASLPESKSFVRVVQIPEMSEAEADSAVPYEAENFIPMPIDQAYLDWQKIGDSVQVGAERKMNVLMVASPKDFVDGYLDVLDGAGLKVAALEVESQSCHRALIPSNSLETVLLVDISDNRSSLIMVEQGSLQFTSTIPIAGNNFTESLARILGIPPVKAEEVKRKVGLSNTAEYPNIKTGLLPVLESLAAEIKNILKFHSEHSPNPVSKVILAGGTAKMKNLGEFLAPLLAETGVTVVEVGNPLQNIAGLKGNSLSPLDALGFTTAIGLAARGMDFRAN